jgi:predicted RNA-binding Zn-ribbon protein involved in translation (DUF1610 family)
MGIYEFHHCPKCGKSLESMVPKGSRGIGEPFQECPKCGSYVVIKRLFNEWALMTDEEKKSIRGLVMKTAILTGGTFGFLVGLFGGKYLFWDTMTANGFNFFVLQSMGIAMGRTSTLPWGGLTPEDISSYSLSTNRKISRSS